MGVGRLSGKTAIVTGATAGIGEAVCRLFAAEGARLVMVARRQDEGDRLVAELGPERAVFVQGDVRAESTAQRAVGEANRWGGPDVLVNNAGMDYTSDVLETPVEDVRLVLEINFVAAFLMFREVARSMRGRGGSIINVTSRTAVAGVPTMVVYGASKGALLSLTKGAAVELAGAGIRVNAVAPGLTETPLVASWLAAQKEPDAFRRRVLTTIPQGRFARPQEVAAAILYLASDESASVTGATLAVDGGYTAA